MLRVKQGSVLCLCFICCLWILKGPTDIRFLGADANTDIREQEYSNIQYPIYRLILYIISAQCVYQILVRRNCHEGRISYILTNFIPNISALNGERFTYQLFNYGPPLLNKLCNCTILNHQFKHFFRHLKTVFVSPHIGKHTCQHQYIYDRSISAGNIGKQIYQSGPS